LFENSFITRSYAEFIVITTINIKNMSNTVRIFDYG
jgi:hypothetical protein